MRRFVLDPSRLEGDALEKWYRRTAEEIALDGQLAAAKERETYFRPSSSPSNYTVQSAAHSTLQDGSANGTQSAVQIARYSPEGTARLWTAELPGDDAGDAEFIEIDSRAKRQRKQWEQREGKPWPTVPETGRNYDRSHIKPKADGGADTVDNIEPKHPDEHRREHMQRGDFKRWGGRAKKGGGPRIGGLGILGIVPNITGLLSGRIRADTPEHFWYDMIGMPSPSDIEQQQREAQRQLFPDCPPGWRCV